MRKSQANSEKSWLDFSAGVRGDYSEPAFLKESFEVFNSLLSHTEG